MSAAMNITVKRKASFPTLTRMDMARALEVAKPLTKGKSPVLYLAETFMQNTIGYYFKIY